MQSKNHACLRGNLGKDPEIRRLNSGDPVANFSLATSESWKDKSTGERKERTQWHQIVCFGPLCEVIEKHLKKGDTVEVDGTIETRTYQDPGGGKDRYSTEIVLRGPRAGLAILKCKTWEERRENRLPPADGPGAASGGNGYADHKGRSGAQAGGFGHKPAGYAGDLDDDVPFAPEWR